MSQLRVTEKALPTHNRQHNRALILQHLFHDGQMSRADLSRASGLTRVTVSDLVGELQAEGLLLDLGPRSDARVGKPATVIALDDDARTIVSLAFSDDDHVTGALLNVRGVVLHRVRVAREGRTGDDAVRIALDVARDLVAASTAPVLGIGIGSPGVVDRDGVVREAPNLGWTDLHLAEVFDAELGVPTHVANDANAAALAIHTFHDGAGKNLMLVLLGDGVGGGLIIGGALVQGDEFTAGEIGHVVIDEDGDPCTCGKSGCLEAAISVSHLGPRLDAADPAKQQRLLRKAGRSLGAALTPIVAALGVNAIILAGPERFVQGTLLDEAFATIESRTLPAATRGLQMKPATNPEDLILQGAAALVLSLQLGIS